MDNSYIKLCAEIAYNDVIIENVLNEEVLNEGEIAEGIKNLFKKFITFIKNLWNKLITFFMEKTKELKTKLEEFKKKREEKAKEEKEESKHESTSLYNQLMEMVLIEGIENIKIIDLEDITKDVERHDLILTEHINQFKKEIFKRISDIQDKTFFDEKQLENEISKMEKELKNQIHPIAIDNNENDHREGRGYIRLAGIHIDYYITDAKISIIDKNKQYYKNLLDSLKKFKEKKKIFDDAEVECNKCANSVKVDNPKLKYAISKYLSILGREYSFITKCYAEDISKIMQAIVRWNQDSIKLAKYEEYQNNKFVPDF